MLLSSNIFTDILIMLLLSNNISPKDKSFSQVLICSILSATFSSFHLNWLLFLAATQEITHGPFHEHSVELKYSSR